MCQNRKFHSDRHQNKPLHPQNRIVKDQKHRVITSVVDGDSNRQSIAQHQIRGHVDRYGGFETRHVVAVPAIFRLTADFNRAQIFQNVGFTRHFIVRSLPIVQMQEILCVNEAIRVSFH
jgi:hypothetical protein